MPSLRIGRITFPMTHSIFGKQLNSICAVVCSRNSIQLVPSRQQSSDEIVGEIAAKEPFEVQLVKGKRYSWCRCGFSKKQPFCDGQHRRYAPGFSPFRFVAEETGNVLLCGCKQTDNPPYCDGTHMSGKVQNAPIGS